MILKGDVQCEDIWYLSTRPRRNEFITEDEPMEFGGKVPLPIAELGPDFVYAKEVRTITPRQAPDPCGR